MECLPNVIEFLLDANPLIPAANIVLSTELVSRGELGSGAVPGKTCLTLTVRIRKDSEVFVIAAAATSMIERLNLNSSVCGRRC